MKPIKAIVNWTLIISMPLWAGFVVGFLFIRDFADGLNTARKAGTGKEWLWNV